MWNQLRYPGPFKFAIQILNDLYFWISETPRLCLDKQII